MHVQETTEALFILLLFLLLLLLLGRLSLLGGGGSDGSSSGVRIGVGDTVLELLNLRPGELGLDGDGKNLLVRVDDGVDDGGQGGVAQGEGDAGNGGNSTRERLQELLLTNVENIGGEGLALVVDLSDTHAVGEGRNVQQVEESGLGRTDLGAGLDELEIGGDFNGTTGNLGGDTEGLEGRGLTGLHTGVSSRDPDVGGSEGTSTGRGGDLVGEDLVTDLLQVGVGKDETNIALDERQETLVLGVVGDEGLEGTTNLFRELD
jgi:hypothetical protein